MVWFLEEGLNPADCKIVLDMDENSETYGSIETIALTITDGKNSCYEKDNGNLISNQGGSKQYSEELLALIETICVTYEINRR